MTGCMSGYAITSIIIENHTIDGNKNNRSENKVNLRGNSNRPFYQVKLLYLVQ
jgi:hypothetical protein